MSLRAYRLCSVAGERKEGNHGQVTQGTISNLSVAGERKEGNHGAVC